MEHGRRCLKDMKWLPYERGATKWRTAILHFPKWRNASISYPETTGTFDRTIMVPIIIAYRDAEALFAQLALFR